MTDPFTSFSAFTSLLFRSARALETLRHALELGDEPLAIHAGGRLRADLERLDQAHATIDPAHADEARSLVVHFQQRANAVLATTPLRLDGLTAIRAFLDRFGRFGPRE